ncbi:hypothetical protein, partial [Acidihalobacter prosperus]
MQNLVYALIQLIHNFGAAAVIGIPVYVLMIRQDEVTDRRRLVVAVTLAWITQLITGFTFGIASLTFYGRLPDIHGVARIALLIKIICAITALGLLFWVLKQRLTYSNKRLRLYW